MLGLLVALAGLIIYALIAWCLLDIYLANRAQAGQCADVAMVAAATRHRFR